MEVSPLSPLEPVTRTGGISPTAAARAFSAQGAGNFADALSKALSSVSEAQQRAEALSQRFQLNDQGVTLEETMIAMQTANLSFQSLVQVRNRLLSAYHDVMNLQV
ncbi:MAG: flagellar hook-basal body complex protein FliE [Betaproteobacteria bacterium]